MGNGGMELFWGMILGDDFGERLWGTILGNDFGERLWGTILVNYFDEHFWIHILFFLSSKEEIQFCAVVGVSGP